MRTVGVVRSPPPLDVNPRVLEREEVVLVQALIPEPAVEAFDVGVLDRFPWLDEVQLDAVIRRPRIERDAPKLAAVVERQSRRPATRTDRRLKCSDDRECRQ